MSEAAIVSLLVIQKNCGSVGPLEYVFILITVQSLKFTSFTLYKVFFSNNELEIKAMHLT